MKLFSKYNRINITTTIIIFLLGSACFYVVLRYILIHELDETLLSEQQEIVQYVQSHHQLPEIENTKEQWISFQQVTQPSSKPFFKSLVFFNTQRHENEMLRQYIFPLQVNNNYYAVTVNKSQEETEYLMQVIIAVTIAMIALILLANFVINRKVLNRLWNPFYNTIEEIKGYHLSNKKQLNLEKENVQVDEFLLLNKNLDEMSLRINKDYDSLKRFTENAAHEMQTPLAVIRSKTEMMMQSSGLKQDSMQHLQEIEDAALKLGKLHQSLLLLAKLENNQFVLNEQVDLKKTIEQKVNEKLDLFHARELILKTMLDEMTVSFHQHLAEILVTNLLNNALRYTPSGGEVTIELANETLIISNTADSGALDTKNIFQRFYKPANTPDGNGLGLAIVKEICVTAGFLVHYNFADPKHVFTVNFKSGL